MGHDSEKVPQKNDINETPLSWPGDVMIMDEEVWVNIPVSISSSNILTAVNVCGQLGALVF